MNYRIAPTITYVTPLDIGGLRCVPVLNEVLNVPANIDALYQCMVTNLPRMRLLFLASLLRNNIIDISSNLNLILMLAEDCAMACGYAYPPLVKLDDKDRSSFTTLLCCEDRPKNGVLDITVQVDLSDAAFTYRPIPYIQSYLCSAGYHARAPCDLILKELFPHNLTLHTISNRLDDEQTKSCAHHISNTHQLLSHISGADIACASQPTAMRLPLMKFQLRALAWMKRREQVGVDSSWAKIGPSTWYSPIFNRFRPTPPPVVRGGYLGVEMGLGKTIIMLARIIDTITLGPTLVVAPVSLLGQWMNEIKRCIPTATAYCYHGPRRLRDYASLSKYEIVVTSFGVACSDEFIMRKKSDSDTYIAPLHKICWHRIVVDEAHTISSHVSKQSRALRSLRAHCRWCMSGTPFKNRIENMYGQMHFLRVFPMGYVAWMRLVHSEFRSRISGAFLWMIKASMLRFKKAQIFDGEALIIPGMYRRIQFLDFTDVEMSTYTKLLQHAKDRMAHGSSHFNKVKLLEPLRQFASIGCDPCRKKAAVMNIHDKATLDNDICSICLQAFDSRVGRTSCQHYFCLDCIRSYTSRQNQSKCPICRQPITDASITYVTQAPPEVGPATSTKLDAIETYIRGLDTTDKVLIFSQFARTLDIVKSCLERMACDFRILSGSMSRVKRSRALHDFQTKPDVRVFLLSTRSCAIGINLTAANRILILDTATNSSLENQAIGRAWRLGQTRPIKVVQLCVRDTVEEHLNNLRGMTSFRLTDENLTSLIS